MLNIKHLIAAGIVAVSGSTTHAATVNATITGQATFEVGDFHAAIADIEVTPSDDPVYGTGLLASGVPQILSWDEIVLTANFNGGNGYTESFTLTDTAAPVPNMTTTNPFDLLPISFFPDFTPDYTAPGVYTQTLTGNVSFFEEQLVTFTQRQCAAWIRGFISYCYRYETVFVSELRNVEVDSGTFSVSRDVTVLAPVPLPAPAMLLLAGLGGLLAMRRRRD